MKQPIPVERELYKNLAIRLVKEALGFFDENVHKLQETNILVYNYLQVFSVVIKETSEIHAAFVLVITFDSLPFDTPFFHASQLSKIFKNLNSELVPIGLIIFQIDKETLEVKGDRLYQLFNPE